MQELVLPFAVAARRSSRKRDEASHGPLWLRGTEWGRSEEHSAITPSKVIARFSSCGECRCSWRASVRLQE
jgi:hypothetical protein